jgi:hypothetical protein
LSSVYSPSRWAFSLSSSIHNFSAAFKSLSIIPAWFNHYPL